MYGKRDVLFHAISDCLPNLTDVCPALLVTSNIFVAKFLFLIVVYISILMKLKYLVNNANEVKVNNVNEVEVNNVNEVKVNNDLVVNDDFVLLRVMLTLLSIRTLLYLLTTPILTNGPP